MEDRRLALRARLARALPRYREMLPGSFVESFRKCGKAGCRCTEGQLHQQYLLSVLVDGVAKTFHVPSELVERVRQQVKQHKDFRQLESEICKLNLEIFLEVKKGK
jgi:hypothetical protein